ncbi:hypothetical protein S83_005408, partial [Arachis hypogaea]
KLQPGPFLEQDCKKQIGSSWSKRNSWKTSFSTKSKEEMDDVEQNFARIDRPIKMQQEHLQLFFFFFFPLRVFISSSFHSI